MADTDRKNRHMDLEAFYAEVQRIITSEGGKLLHLQVNTDAADEGFLLTLAQVDYQWNNDGLNPQKRFIEFKHLETLRLEMESEVASRKAAIEEETGQPLLLFLTHS